MVTKKWNCKLRKYERYEIPKEWNVALYEDDMNTIVNCACCGRLVRYGDCYTSKHIHNSAGFGYAVWEKCYEGEWKEENELLK